MEDSQHKMWGDPTVPRNAIPVLPFDSFYHSDENGVWRTGRNNVFMKKLEAPS